MYSLSGMGCACVHVRSVVSHYDIAMGRNMLYYSTHFNYMYDHGEKKISDIINQIIES